jgi:beta-glucosidase
MRRASSSLLSVHLLPALVLLAAPALAQLRVDPAIEARIDTLLGKMTLAEKIGQLNQHSSFYDLTGPPPAAGRARVRYEMLKSGGVGSMLNVTGAEATRATQQLVVENSRLGIPLLFGYDVIHGYKTMAPIPLAEAASWDLEAVERSARMAAIEASASGLHWAFAPMVDIARDARWGRIMEGAGEDPYLGARMAAARERGFQGEDLAAPDTIAACVKHLAGYGFAEAGREYNTVDFSEQTLRNVVLPPFRAAIEAGAATVMNAFNDIGGIPATASHHLQRTILRDEWGFNGFVLTDWATIDQLMPHGVAASERDAAKIALEAGSDMDMESEAFSAHLASLVESGAVDPGLVDDAVRRVLRVKFQLGLFEDPYRYSDPEREERWVLSQEMHDASLDIARKSIVLLQNEGGLLPLAKDDGTIAVIGPLADDKDSPLGSWRGKAESGTAGSAVSLLEGIRAAVGEGATVRHAQGAPLMVGAGSFNHEITLNETDRSGFPAAVEAARGADVVILALGEVAFQTGEGRSQVDIGLKGVQEDLLREIQAVNENIVLVLMNGRPLALPAEAAAAPAIVEAWHLGSQAGHAIAEVLFGDTNPSGKLPVSFPHHVGQEPLYYNVKNTGRPLNTGMVYWSHYTDAPNTALFPFGHGLSYTTFAYSEPRLSATEIGPDDSLEVAVTVTNTGDRAGAEVVQLYIRDLVASATRPVKELKGFQKIELAPGESREVTFSLGAADLAFYTPRGSWEAEPGEFQVFVGTSSETVQTGRFTLR